MYKLALFISIVIALIAIFAYVVLSVLKSDNVTPTVPTPTVPTPTVPTITAISNYRSILDSDMYGFDLPNGGITVNSEEECATACNKQAGCAFFTYNSAGKGCWLKGPTSDPANSVTGLRRGDGTYMIYPKTDVSGFDIQSYNNTTQAQCEKNCESNSKCGLYHFNADYNGGSCWLKAPNAKPGYDSYFRKTN